MIVFSVNFPSQCTSFLSEPNYSGPHSVLHGSEIYSSYTELYRIRIHTDVRTFSFLMEFFLFFSFFGGNTAFVWMEGSVGRGVGLLCLSNRAAFFILAILHCSVKRTAFQKKE